MPKTLAERLKEVREASGLSARALDEKADITAGHTALIESGLRKSPAVETIRKLAVALNVSLDWLVTGAERESVSALAADESGEHGAVTAPKRAASS